jgi:hypothetical protein
VAVYHDHLRRRFGVRQRVEELHLPHRAARAEQQQAVAVAQGSVACVAVGVGDVPAARAHHQQAVVVQPADIDGHGGHCMVAGEAERTAVAQGVLRGFQQGRRRLAENQDVREAVGRVGVAKSAHLRRVVQRVSGRLDAVECHPQCVCRLLEGVGQGVAAKVSEEKGDALTPLLEVPPASRGEPRIG